MGDPGQIAPIAQLFARRCLEVGLIHCECADNIFRTQWGPVIHAVKRNPDFIKHSIEYRVILEKEHELKGRHYEPLLMMNHATLRVEFSATLSQDATPPPIPLTRPIYTIDDWSSECTLEDGSSIPHLVLEGNIT